MICIMNDDDVYYYVITSWRILRNLDYAAVYLFVPFVRSYDPTDAPFYW